MAVKKEWMEDSEALSVAMEIQNKFNEMFAGIELDKIRFIRVMDQKNGKAIKVATVGFPFNIDVNYLYYVMVDDLKWSEMSEAQRNLLVFSGLYEIAPGGMNPESASYGKKRKRDIEDFDDVIAVAGGRYDWQKTGATGLHDILQEQKETEEQQM